MRIGIDLMGSDRSPQVMFEACLQAARQYDASHTFVVFANPEAVTALSELQKLANVAGSMAKIEFHPAAEVITMRDDPIQAIRQKRHSSLVQGIRQLKKKGIDAFVSAGNTGALIASATLTLPLLPTIRRPALLAALPTENGHVAVCDVGGNLLAKAQHLVRFAELGASFVRHTLSIAKPRIGLLNVGIESKKGTKELREAYQMLEELSANSTRLHFVGNVEGREVFQGKVDVLVSDGFTGNILLKSSEGVAFFILDFLRKTIYSSPSSDGEHVLQKMQKHFSYSEYPGAILLGIDGVVVKCHGDSSAKALYNGIKAASSYVEKQLIAKMKQDFQP